jgi:hypothetical protein
MPFPRTKQLVCLDCQQPFIATVVSERRGNELVLQTTPCPECGGVGAPPIELPGERS